MRADLGAGFANGDGGMMTRGDSGLVLAVLAVLVCDAALDVDETVVVDVVDVVES